MGINYEVDSAGRITVANNQAFSQKESGGTSRELLKLDGSDEVFLGTEAGTSVLKLQSGGILGITVANSGEVTASGTMNATTFSGSGASLTSLNATNLSTGTVADLRLSTNVTLEGNSFNGTDQLVQLDGSGFLTALNGSALTSLNATNLSSGTVDDARLTTNVTLEGNAFNGASQLVQLDGSTRLPAIDGSQLTSLTIPVTVPEWEKFTVYETAFTAAAASESITLFSLPAGGVIHNVKIKHSTAFTGGTIADYTVEVGISGNETKYAAAFDVFQAVSDTALQLIPAGPFAEDHGSATDVLITARSASDDVADATAGGVEIWVQKSVVV